MKKIYRFAVLAAFSFSSFACESFPSLDPSADEDDEGGSKGTGGSATVNDISLLRGMGGETEGGDGGGPPTVAGPECGDGFLDDDEQCDDGNGKPTDGCTGICTIEAGYLCQDAGAPCVLDAECGNGVREAVAGEQCDDGNEQEGDGCRPTCQVEDGWTCNDSGCSQAMVSVCGDGSIGPGEGCEDGESSPTSGDGCSASCQVEDGYECLLLGEVCTPILSEFCGNGILVSGEYCDDGNQTPGDGCNAQCEVETGYACDGAGSCAIVCGDSVVVGQEACDDGDSTAGNGCEADCLSVTPGFVCPTAQGVGGVCVLAGPGAQCPNSILEFGEECDDGNINDLDGCSDCVVDDGFVCSSPGSLCVLIPVCGDGFVDVAIGEQCDTAILGSTDGCSDSCQAEGGFICPVPTVSGNKLLGGSCTAIICGDGAKQGTEECDDDDLGESAGERNDDGCLDDCTVDSGWVCPLNASCQAVQCGDSIVAGIEDCDNGALNDGATSVANVICDSNCQIVPDAALCGNGQVDAGEVCDELDNNLGDGCGIDCKWEPLCNPPAACTSPCGDGIKFGSEQCDDGNQRDGDGCSSSCSEEAGFSCSEQASGSIELPVVYRDFKYWENSGGHVAFQWSDGDPIDHTPDQDIWVRTTLGTSDDTLADGTSLLGKPIFKWYVGCDGSGCAGLTPGVGESQPQGTDDNPANCNAIKDAGTGVRDMSGYGRDVFFCGYGAQDFNTFSQWYRDDASVNSTIRSTLTLNETSAGSGVYQFSDDTFFPIDGEGFGNEGNDHNFSFTSEVRYWFEYDDGADANLDFYGDDDVWVFVNGSLVVDISGTHGQENDSVTLNASATDIEGNLLNLVDGSVYEIVVFQAERNTSGSNYQLTLSGFSLAKSNCQSFCGDGVKASNEQCDDGNSCGDSSTCTDGRCDDGSLCNEDGAYGACSTTCKLGPFCGDNNPDAGFEDCDDGRNNALYSVTGADTCATGCVWAPYCGDGTTAVGFEQCDGGADCESDCTLVAQCGDGTIDASEGEQCDDAANNGTLSSECDLMCKVKCGNATVDAGEQCDPGAGNFSSEYGGCLPKIDGIQDGCLDGPSCGDGLKNGPESCDDGLNDGSYGTCGVGCTLPPRCGDGALQASAGEVCDNGASNVTQSYAASGGGQCNIACVPVRYCGDGAITNGEVCDDGVNDGSPGSCLADCSAWVSLSLCGTNQALDEGEECDPSIAGTPAGSCDSQCRFSCGNGAVNTEAPYSEECDDGVNSGGYGTCQSDCTLAPYCGDGSKNGPEQCDRGQSNESAPYGAGKCTNTCKDAPQCGDGRIDTDNGEQCDGAPGCVNCRWGVVG